MNIWKPSPESGFICHAVPHTPDDLRASPDEHFSALGRLAGVIADMPDEELDQMIISLPPHPPLTTELTPEMTEGLIRAYVNIAAHLIHRPYFFKRRELPPPVARPLWELSKMAGRPPSLTYASYVLANFEKPLKSRMFPSEIEVAQTPSCTPDEEWFVAVHLSAETAGGEVVKAVHEIEAGLNEEDTSKTVTAIHAVESAMWFANDVMPTVSERMAPDIFRNKIRPLLYGHDKITFRGVTGEPTITYVGETGAQSGMIRAADLVLGVRHSEMISTAMDRFLVCAPPSHRDFFHQTALTGQRLISDLTKNPEIFKARHSALLALTQFRKTHLDVVIDYLVPYGERLAERGTGGTNFTDWLQKIIDETEANTVG